MSILNPVERKNGIDYWFDSSLAQQRHNLVRKCRSDRDLLFQRSRAEHCTDDVKTFAQDVVEIDFGLTSGDSTDENDPASQSHRFKTRGEIWTSVQIENNVKSAIGRLLRKSSKP